MIMQENRSFDEYFGTYPGADGIPANTCIPVDPSGLRPELGCVRPFHDPHDVNAGGPHDSVAAKNDLDDGVTTNKMDGFLYQQIHSGGACVPNAPNCAGSLDGQARRDAIGYHTAEEIPNYWAYAKHFVLQDRLFESERSWSWPAHLGLTSEWVATCADGNNAATCVTSDGGLPGPQLPWANLFQLLDAHKVSWKYYLATGPEPDCEDGEMACAPHTQAHGLPSIWNPPPFFKSVNSKGAAYMQKHNPIIDQFLVDVKNGTLPEVSWLVPTETYSEHPPCGVTLGMEYVTAMVNAVMQSRYWKDTVIFISWDDWGGFYDHVPPPNIDWNTATAKAMGYGLRVPGITISPYAKAGTIDHHVLSFDAYATFIEDLFMDGARLNPVALGVPDKRPDIRDALTVARFPNGTTEPIGRLMDEFDFTQKPLKPLILSTYIPTQINANCSSDNRQRCTQPVVTVSWAPVTGPEVTGSFTYHVTRDGKELPQCVGTAASCTDRPGKGAHLYRAYSVDSDGVASPPSAAAEADEP